jgi:hypothetical protein
LSKDGVDLSKDRADLSRDRFDLRKVDVRENHFGVADNDFEKKVGDDEGLENANRRNRANAEGELYVPPIRLPETPSLSGCAEKKDGGKGNKNAPSQSPFTRGAF